MVADDFFTAFRNMVRFMAWRERSNDGKRSHQHVHIDNIADMVGILVARLNLVLFGFYTVQHYGFDCIRNLRCEIELQFRIRMISRSRRDAVSA